MVRLAMSERRELLIAAAWRVLVRDGVRAATTRAICAEAQMPQSAFHYCFDSRAELLRLIVTGEIPKHIASTFHALDVADSSDDLVLGPLTAFFDEVEHNPMQHAVLYDITVNALYDPQLADLAQFQYAEYFRAAIAIFDRAASRQSITWDLPVDVLATGLLNFLDGLVLRYIVDRDSVRARATLEAYGRDLARHASSST